MKSLYSHVDELEEIKWNYYFSFPNNRSLLKPFISDNSSLEFIEQYFKKGGKDEVLKNFEIKNFSIARTDHTASLFFFGVLLFHNTEFTNKIFFNEVVNSPYEFFPFIWFLTCLAHDAAFDLEKDEKILEKISTLEDLKIHLKIEHDLMSKDVKKISKDLFNSCSQYYYYRKTIHKANDHGIYAGVLLYDQLVKNRLIQKAKDNNSHSWADSLDKEYAFAAATIAIHNMWLPDDKTRKEYSENGLSGLIGKTQISFAESPLLYFLGIIDTIEPVKAYSCADPVFVLKHISINFIANTIIKIRVSPELNFEILKKKAESLESWLDVKVSSANREILIELSF